MVKIRCAMAAAVCLLAGVMMFRMTETKTYRADDSAFANAMIGYAPMTDNPEAGGATLRYLELTWREVEPEEGVYAWDVIEEKYGLASLRAQGVHLVLRFICDTPKKESHLDIPDWLYTQTGNGSWYDTSYGKGYSPDYADEVFRAAHHRVIAALADHFDRDGFAAYVELGSLGHWGEWHIKSGEGLVPMPGEAIRDEYETDYTRNFTNAKLLMRRPFRSAAADHLGLYNDMVGHEKDTDEWLGWIEAGGWYGDEADALTAMPDFWQTAPVGGEFTSALTMEKLLQTNLPRTLELIRKSHMSFIGPKVAEQKFHKGYREVLKSLGYRLRVTQLELTRTGKGASVTLTLANDGAAPFYWDWDVNLYLENRKGQAQETCRLPLNLPDLLPGEEQTVTVQLDDASSLYSLWNNSSLTLGIVDPMTGRDAVRFAMKTPTRNGRAVLVG